MHLRWLSPHDRLVTGVILILAWVGATGNGWVSGSP